MIIPNKYNGYRADGTRIYPKGGDPGAAAQEQENKRQARIAEAVKRINTIFDSGPVTVGQQAAKAYDPSRTYYTNEGAEWMRPMLTRTTEAKFNPNYDIDGAWEDRYIGGDEYQEVDHEAARRAFADGGLFESVATVTPTNRNQLYDDQKKAVYELNARDVQKQFEEASRQNKFGLARSGLAGGSVDIDSNAQLQEKNNEGLMKATGIADAAAAELKTADERSRQNLITMAQSGIDTGDAQQMALRGLEATAQQAQGKRTDATIGNLFGDLSQAYLYRQLGAGQRSGMQPWQQTRGAGPASPHQTYAGS
jgi:hypothetical protein